MSNNHSVKRGGAGRPPKYKSGPMVRAPEIMAPQEMVEFCEAQPEGYSAFIRKLIEKEMKSKIPGS